MMSMLCLISFAQERQVQATSAFFRPNSRQSTLKTRKVRKEEVSTFITSPLIDYDSNGNMLKETYYHADGQTIKTIATPDYDQNGNKIIKEIEYCKDGKTIKWILEKEPETKKVLKQTNYEADGKTIKEVIEYS